MDGQTVPTQHDWSQWVPVGASWAVGMVPFIPWLIRGDQVGSHPPLDTHGKCRAAHSQQRVCCWQIFPIIWYYHSLLDSSVVTLIVTSISPLKDCCCSQRKRARERVSRYLFVNNESLTFNRLSKRRYGLMLVPKQWHTRWLYTLTSCRFLQMPEMFPSLRFPLRNKRIPIGLHLMHHYHFSYHDTTNRGWCPKDSQVIGSITHKGNYKCRRVVHRLHTGVAKCISPLCLAH